MSVTINTEIAGGGGSDSSPPQPPWLDGMVGDYSTEVSSVTGPSAGGTPANEYLASDAYNTSSATDGQNDWGMQGAMRMVRCTDGTLFAVVFKTATIVIMRSATGGTYGSAWTTVFTVTKANQNTGDQQVYMVRNPVTDTVHVMYSDLNGSNAACYKMTTLNSAGTTLHTIRVPDTWPGSGPVDEYGWFAGLTDASGEACRGGLSVSADGLFCFTQPRPSCGAWPANPLFGLFTLAGRPLSDSDSVVRYQFMRFDGSWQFSQIYTAEVGLHLTYHYVWVDHPGRPGKVVVVGAEAIKYSEYLTAGGNPNWPGPGSWTNAENADIYGGGSFFGGGAGPASKMMTIDIADPTQWTMVDLWRSLPRTADLPNGTGNTAGDYCPVKFYEAEMDSAGNIWALWNEYDDETYSDTLQTRRVDVYSSHTGALLATATAPWSDNTPRLYQAPHDGRMWYVFNQPGNAAVNTKMRFIKTAYASGTITQDTVAASTELKETPFGTNDVTAKYEWYLTTFPVSTPRSGSAAALNFCDLWCLSRGDYTGAGKGTTYPAAPADGAWVIKRVRVQLPRT